MGRTQVDLAALVAEGIITEQQAMRIAERSPRGSVALGVQVLGGLGMVALVVGLVVYQRQAFNPGIPGLLMVGVALFARRRRGGAMPFMTSAILVVGAGLVAGSAIVSRGEGSSTTYALIATGFAVLAWVSGNGLLGGAAVVAVLLATWTQASGVLSNGRLPSMWLLIAVMSVVALACALFARGRAASAQQRVATIAMRTAIVAAQVPFWVGATLEGTTSQQVAFAIAWAVQLLLLWAWGSRTDDRWLVTAAATFGAVELASEWFRRLGVHPMNVAVGGLGALGFALWLSRFRRAGYAPEAGLSSGAP